MERAPANLRTASRVLLQVRDERLRRTLRRALASDGHVVLACHGIPDGIGAPTVVVSDWPPPEDTDARSWDGVPLIALVADRDAAEAALAAGARDCIMGDIRPGEVCMRVQSVGRRGEPAPAADAGGPAGLLDALPAGVAVLGPDGGVSQANAALCDLLGCAPADLVGRAVTDTDVLGDDGHALDGLLRDARLHGRAAAELTLGAAAGGRRVAVTVTATRDDAGTLSAYVLTARAPSGQEAVEAAVSRLARAASSAVSDLGTVIAREAAAVTGGRAAVLARATGDIHVVAGAWGGDAPARGTLLRGDGRRAVAAALRGAAGPAAVITASLRVAGRVWGRVAVAVPREDAGPARARLERFTRVAAIAATDIDGSQAPDRAGRDPLTGLPGHTAFFARLAREAVTASRGGVPLSLVIIDLDHFKRLNDRFGHPAGDRTLREVADRVLRVARRDDVVARIGGEEFGWLMPATGLADALELARRARQALSEAPYPVTGPLTASLGVAQGGVGDGARATPEDLHRQAEVALHWAKISGRNRCAAYSFEIAEEVFAQRATASAETPNLRAMRALAWAVDARDPHTHRHSARVADLSVQIAAALGWTVERITQLREAGLMHDVGKIAVPDRILFKPGRLTAEEFEVVKRHPVVGAQIVADAMSPEQAAWVRAHHERWDGGGYPDGLAGADIPEEARVLALADAWDVIVSTRAYKEPLSVEGALTEMRRCSGTQFWPDAVEALSRLVEAGAVGAGDVLLDPVAAPAAAEAPPVRERLRA